MTTMTADKMLAAVRIELCAAMRDGDDPWDHVEKHPVVKRFDAAVAAMIEREAALVAEVEALRADAKRYRWLRDDSNFANRHAPAVVSCPLDDSLKSIICDKELDEAIDAARAEARK